MRYLISIVLFSVTQAIQAAPDGWTQREAMTRITAEKIQFNNSENMGLLGANYLVETLPNLYMGAATYGALTGQRGGFFTVGAEFAWQQKINPLWEIGLGLYAGGGGGGNANTEVGGGLMLRPHIDILRNMNDYRAGLSLSQVIFPSGKIQSKQFGVVFVANADFLQLAQRATSATSSFRSGVGFDRVYAVLGQYHGYISSPLKRNSIGLVGFRMEQRRTENLFWGIEAAGAASGGVAGYAEFLGTVGLEYALLDNQINVTARFAAGMGGGGAVLVGGGQLYKLGVLTTLNVTPYTHMGLEGGYAFAPTGFMRTRYLAANLRLDLDHPFTTTPSPQVINHEFLLGSSRYLHTAHKNRRVNAMDVVTLKINRYLSDSFYLSGQAHSTYAGNNEGGFSAGLFGLGAQSELIEDKLRIGAEMLLGAAGGGGVDSSGGAMVSPGIYIDWQLNPLFSIRLASTRIKSLNGALNTQTAEFGIKFSYAAMSR